MIFCLFVYIIQHQKAHRAKGEKITAGIFKRWFALFLEGFILGILCIIPNVVGSIGVAVESIAIVLIGFILYFVILIGYLFVQIKYWKYGQSIGKKILKLRVVREDGQTPLGLGEMAIREIFGKWLSSILMIGYIIAFFDEQKRTLHDRLVSSIVIDESK